MTVRNLDALFRPQSVALIGASRRRGSLGNRVARNLRAGGFKGTLVAVNPKYRSVAGLACYRDIEALPEAPELAILVAPAPLVPSLVAGLAVRGTRAAVVIGAGFGGAGAAPLRQAVLDAARPYNFRILGPGGIGIISPVQGLNASAAHLMPRAGRLALVAQSGTLLTALIDWAQDHDIGFSHLVSLGSVADVDLADTLNYLAEDRDTDAILLYAESICSARKFMSAARMAGRLKPVMVLKAGRYEAGGESQISHSAAAVSHDAVFDRAFRRAGLLPVGSMSELFDMAMSLAHGPPATGERLAIVTNSGGAGLLAADAQRAANGRFVQLSAATTAQLDRVLPPGEPGVHTVDLGDDANPALYQTVLTVLRDAPEVDALLVLHCPVSRKSSTEVAQAVVDSLASAQKPVLTSWLGEHSARFGRALLATHRFPGYPGPGEAVRAFLQRVAYRHNQELLVQTPPSLPEAFHCERDTVTALVARALDEGRTWLTDAEVRIVLDAYAIPTVATYAAHDASEAARHATRIGGPVVLKIVAPDLAHKSDAGGVMLDLEGSELVLGAARTMQARLREAHPAARLEGFVVQPMVRWPHAVELIAGIANDALFGPVVLFGHGGTTAEVIDDKSIALPPLNMMLAQRLIDRTRIAKLLAGNRNRPPANLDAIALTLTKLSQLAIDQPHIAALDINPLFAAPRGVLAMGARIRLSAAPCSGADRFAIRPYPQELEQVLTVADGRTFTLRPIRPEDEPALRQAFQRLNPEEIRLRFHHAMKTLGLQLAIRLTQLDYDREMAFALLDPAGDIYGVVRLSANPDRESAEFAIIVGHPVAGMGLGTRLMNKLIDYARNQGIGQLVGYVLADNNVMLGLCRKLGFASERSREDVGEVVVTLDLGTRE